MKWACCGVNGLEKWRYERLQEELGSDHELVFLDWKDGADWDQELAGFHHVRWGESFQMAVSKQLKAHSTWTALLGTTDGMVLRDSRWWPLCASYEALWQTFTALGQGIDLDDSAFIDGTGAMARAGIAALFKCGFRRFRIPTESVEISQALVKDIRVRFLGIELEMVPIDKIVLLAGISSVFINTLRPDEAPELSKEISYLNFLKRPGALINTGLYTKPTTLLKEAADTDVSIVDGWHIAARVDSLWAEWAFKKKLDIRALQNIYATGAAQLG